MTVRFAGLVAESLHFGAEPQHALQLHLLTQGAVWLEQPGQGSRLLAAPTVAVIPSHYRYSLRPQAGHAGHLLHIETVFAGPAEYILLEALDQSLLLTLNDSNPELHHVVQIIASELSHPRCGHPALLARAGEILFIGVLRHLLEHPGSSSGLLSGLADPRIARALVAIHSAPQASWNLEVMAEQAGMSRTGFAVKFRQVMGCTPGSYLRRFRLSIADKAVINGQGLKRAARLSGYTSAAALARALGRRTAAAPSRPL